MHNNIVLGVDLGGTNVRVGKIENNNIIDLYSQRISSQADDDQVVIDEVVSSIEKVFDNSVVGIGVGVPSVVDNDTGIVYDVQNIPSWRAVPLRDILVDKFRVPVFINNDANCFVAGEKYFGKAKEYKNVVGLIMGTGFGAGLILNNKLYNGTNCGAGEFGMINYREDVYESYCCGQFFSKEYNLGGDEVFKLAEAGDKKGLQIFEEFGYHVGNALKTVLFSVDPDVIILGGSVSKAYKYFEKSMRKILASFPYSSTASRIRIEISEMNHIAVLGAGALYFDNLGIELKKELKLVNQ